METILDVGRLEGNSLGFLMDTVQVKNQCGSSTSIRTHTDKLHSWSCQESYSALETAGEYIFIKTDCKNCLPHTDTFTSYILKKIYRVWIQIHPHKMSTVKLVHLESGSIEPSIRSF